ncbi:oligosaccharide flippase family protein [Spirulina subsalsa CS-330]|nr:MULTISPECIES: oligosaccharide flippase family protein [Spirulina]MDB9494336.1 oligosaccharide flippase family protein [Spirulina subsalsa CS-330]
MASAPLLTRLYTTEQFGLVAVFGSMLSIFSVVSSLSYELAIPIAKDDDEAVHGVVLGLFVALGISLLTFLGVLCFREQIATAVNLPAMAGYLWLLPLGLLLRSIYQIFYYWGLRVKAFSAIARTKLTQSVGSVVVQLGGASFGTIALLLGQVVGQAAGISSLAVVAVRNRWDLFKAVRFKQVLWFAWRYRQFPYFSTWGGLLNTIGAQMPPVLFAILFSPAAAGIYALAHRVLSLPMSLVGQAIGNVFLAKAADARREGNLAVLVARVHEKLAQIAMPPALLLAIIGPDLFVWVFGPEWHDAGIFARLMTPMLYFQFILSPISSILNVLERQDQNMLLQGIMCVCRAVSCIIGATLGDLKLAVFLFSLGSAFSYLAFLGWIFKISGNPLAIIIKSTGKTFIRGCILVSPIIITNLIPSNSLLLVASLLLTGFLILNQYRVILQ